MRRLLFAIPLILAAECSQAQVAQRQQAAFSGAIAGGPVNYTMNVPTPLGWQNTRGFRVCGAWPQLNEGPATLSVEKKPALPIRMQTLDGNISLAGHELFGTQCLVVDDTENAFVFEGVSGGIMTDPGPVPYPVSKSEWTYGRHFVFEGHGELTLPDAETIGNQGGIVVQTLPGAGVTLRLASNQDGINGAPPGFPEEILSNTTTIITTSGAHGTFAFRVPLGGGGGGGGGGVACAEADAFIARAQTVDSTLDAIHERAYRQLICELVNDGVWPFLDGLWIPATQTKLLANLNVKSADYTLTPSAVEPAWTANEGYKGGADMGSTVYLDTHLNPATSPTVATLASVHIMAWPVTSVQSSGYASAIGAGWNTYTTISPWVSGGGNNRWSCALNTGTAAGYQSATDLTSSAMGYLCNRSGLSNSTWTGWRNGQQLTMASTSTATALPNGNLFLLGQSGASGMVNGSALTIAAASYGEGFLDMSQISGSGSQDTGTGLLPRVCKFLKTVRGSC